MGIGERCHDSNRMIRGHTKQIECVVCRCKRFLNVSLRAKELQRTSPIRTPSTCHIEHIRGTAILAFNIVVMPSQKVAALVTSGLRVGKADAVVTRNRPGKIDERFAV